MITIASLMVDGAKLQYGMPATVKMFNGFKTRSDGEGMSILDVVESQQSLAIRPAPKDITSSVASLA